MAQETRIFDIQGFSGGESDDITRGPKDSFYSGENIEVRKNLNGMILAPKMVDTGWTISGDIIFMKNLADLGYSGIVVATDTGNVYLNGTLKTTLATGTSAWDRIMAMGVNVISGTTYFYYCTQTTFGDGKVHRSTTNLTTWNVSYKSFTTASFGGSPKVKAISQDSAVFFGVNNAIIKIDAVETISNALELPELEEVYGFTFFQNNYKIYTNFGNQGVQYYWDGLDILPSYRQVWDNQNVLDVVNNGAFDYAVLGYKSYETYNDLYIISGTQKEPVRVNLEANTNSRIFDGYMSIREDIVYISGGLSGESGNYGVYTYGNYYPGTSKSLVQSYSHNNTHKVLFHVHDAASSYFATQDDKVYQINHNNPPTYHAVSGYGISHVYEGNQWEEYIFDKTLIAFELQTGTSVKIYYRKNIGDSWGLAKTIDYATYSAKCMCVLSANEVTTAGVTLGVFSTLQIKIELISNNEFTPKVKRVTTFLKTVNQ